MQEMFQKFQSIDMQTNICQQNVQKQSQNQQTILCNENQNNNIQTVNKIEYFENHDQVMDYRILQKIDEGFSGEIKLCQKYPITDQKLIIKIFKNTNNKDKQKNCEQDFQREVKSLQALKHTNIVSLIDVINDAPYKKHQNISNNIIQIKAVVLEYCENGCLYDYLELSKGFKESISRKIFKDVVQVIKYMQEMEFVHRDLKIENILLDEEFQIKIADFSFADNINKNQNKKFKTILGTQSSQAPEILEGQEYEGFKVDIFALGVILFVFMFGHYPFAKACSWGDNFYKAFLNNQDLFWKAHHKQFMKKQDCQQINEEEIKKASLKDLIQKLLNQNPEERPTIQEIEAHEWFIDENIASNLEQKEFFQNLKLQKQKVC